MTGADWWALAGTVAFLIAIAVGSWAAFRECYRWPLEDER